MTEKPITLLDAEPTFLDAPGDGLIIRKEQIITDKFLQHCADARHESTQNREREFMHVAAIPTIVVEQWLREGFNIYEASAREIVARLKTQNLDAFLTTKKRV